jgi:GDP-fucose transporter C1
MFGAFCGVASSSFVALNAIYTTRCLPCVDNNVWRLCLYNNFNACILFIPLMLIFGELPAVINYSKLFDLAFWFAMTMAGVLGFSMGYVTGYQIQMTSPLTHNVSGTAKSYVQTLLAVVIYTEVRRRLSEKNKTNEFIDFYFLDENITLVDIEFICSWWFRFICTC